MKKSLVLGIAAAASLAFTEAAWINTGPSAGAGEARSISTLGSLVNERSVSTLGALKYAGAEKAKAAVSGLAVESRAIGTRWKDAPSGGLGSFSSGVDARFEDENAPEASTWGAVLGVFAMIVWSSKQQLRVFFARKGYLNLAS